MTRRKKQGAWGNPSPPAEQAGTSEPQGEAEAGTVESAASESQQSPTSAAPSEPEAEAPEPADAAPETIDKVVTDVANGAPTPDPPKRDPKRSLCRVVGDGSVKYGGRFYGPGDEFESTAETIDGMPELERI